MHSIFNNHILNETFIKGINYFNSSEFQEAHISWEKIWKKGNAEDRKKVKGYIQLTAAIINNIRKKKKASNYLFEKSINNIGENNFRNILNQDKLIDDIKSFHSKGRIRIIVYNKSF